MACLEVRYLEVDRSIWDVMPWFGIACFCVIIHVSRFEATPPPPLKCPSIARDGLPLGGGGGVGRQPPNDGPPSPGYVKAHCGTLH